MPLIPGFWMNAAEANADSLREIARRGLARGHTVANGVSLAKEIYDIAAAVNTDEPIVIVREDIQFDQNYRDARYSPVEYAASAKKRLAAFPEGLWQIGNEWIFSSLSEFRFGMQRAIDLMEEFHRQGVRFSIGGWADAATWQRPIIEAGEADKFLEVVGQITNEPDFLAVDNDHNYVYGSLAHNGGGKDSRDMLEPSKLRREGWPTYDDMNKASSGFLTQGADDLDGLLAYAAAEYLMSERGIQNVAGFAQFKDVRGQTPDQYLAGHIQAQGAEANWTQMRYVWKDIRAAAQGYKPAKRFIGECFWDDMPHGRIEGWIQAIERLYAGGRKLRGTLDQRELWPKMWPGWDAVKAYIEQIDWWVWVQPPNVVGASAFCLNNNPQWTSFNLLNWPELWPAWYEYVYELKAKIMAQTTLPREERPLNCGSSIAAALNVAQDDGFIRVRHRPSTLEGVEVHRATEGERVNWYPDTKRYQDNREWEWVYVEFLDRAHDGWMARVPMDRPWEAQFISLEVPTTPPVPEPEPEPEPTPSPTPTPPIVAFPPLPEMITGTSESRRQWATFLHALANYIEVFPGQVIDKASIPAAPETEPEKELA